MSAAAESVVVKSKSRASGLLIALIALSAMYVPLRMMMESADISDALYNGAYMYGTALQILFAGVIVAVAVGIGTKQSIGRQWLLLGLGVTVYAIGDVCWTLFELYLNIDPFPSLADVFYASEYIFFIAALTLAVAAYRRLVDIKKATAIGVLVALLGSATLYVILLKPYIFPASLEDIGGIWGRFVSVLYPVGDVVLMLAPAIALALVVRQLGAGRLARPWWLVVAGALVFACVDSLFIYAEWVGTGYTATMDLGYVVANLLFASAALVARDVYHTR